MPKGLQGFQSGHPKYTTKGDFKKGQHSSSATEFKKGFTPWNKDTKGLMGVHWAQGKHPEHMQGKNHPMYGKHHTEKSLKKMSKNRRGKYVGENNNMWKGGITSLYERIRKLPEYKEWRTAVYERDNYTCQKCGSQESGTLNAHHNEKSFEDILQEFLQVYDQFSLYEDTDTLVRLAMKYEPFWDISIGITYCEDCHIKKHKTITIGNK